MKTFSYLLLLTLTGFCVGDTEDKASPADVDMPDISPDATELPASFPSSTIDVNLFEAMKAAIPNFNPDEWTRGVTSDQDGEQGDDEPLKERDEMNLFNNLRMPRSAPKMSPVLEEDKHKSSGEDLRKFIEFLREYQLRHHQKRDQNEFLEDLGTYLSIRGEDENVEERDNESLLEELLSYLSARDENGKVERMSKRDVVEMASQVMAGKIPGHKEDKEDGRVASEAENAPTGRSRKRDESTSDKQGPAKRDLARLNTLKNRAGYNALPPCAKICAARCISKQIHAAGMQSHVCVVSPAQCMCNNINLGYCLIDCGTLNCKAVKINAIYALLNWGANFCDPHNFM